MQLKSFTFNPFQENTYVLWDDSKECVIIDAGCYFEEERQQLTNWIKDNQLTPVKLISTHSHLDHVFGNYFVTNQYTIPLGIHPKDKVTLESLSRVAEMYGIPNVDESPEPSFYFEEGNLVSFGNSELDVLFVPGHAPGHVVFVSKNDGFVINGDCLFDGSIGRTDLPGGNHQELIDAIQSKLFTLPDGYVVYCGHGASTTIGKEKNSNPFF